MSLMIPSTYDHRLNISEGEKKLFDQLKTLDDSYVVIHSLGIAQHRKKIFSEIDFVIICEAGILCLEVKGGHVRRSEGLWVFTNRHGKENYKSEGPFEQSVSAMFALRDYLKNHFKSGDPLVKCCYACGVAFPDTPFTQIGPDIIDEIILDPVRPAGGLRAYITNVFAYWRDQIKNKHGFNCGKLTGQDISKAAAVLRGDFGLVPPLSMKIQQTEEKLLALTQEQVDRLAMASDNPRILLAGGAGTGKTLLSLEHALRFAIKGERVLYLCFNKNISRHLKALVADKPDYIGENLTIATFHEYITAQLKSGSHLPENPALYDNVYFDEKLPEAFIDMCNCGNYRTEFDRLIVDEGQDLLKYQYILCFDSILKKGLASGKWHISYDPNQNIYNDEFEDGLEMIYTYNPVRLSLDTNCRNTRPVGIYNTLITGIPPAKHFRVEGENVINEVYSNNSEQRRMLVKAVRNLLGQGANPGSICLLSRYKFANSCLEGKNLFAGICPFRDITDLVNEGMKVNAVKFSTIHSFKGLEAPIVFVLDIDGFSKPEDIHLNYVALSRTTTMLYIYYNNDVKAEMDEMIGKAALLLNMIED